MSGKPVVVVASKNPVKIAAVQGALERTVPGEAFEVAGIEVGTAIADQPRSDAETLSGAEERARAAAELRPEADYWVGIEGGIEDSDAGMTAFAWIVVKTGFGTGRARSGTFFLPDRVALLVRQGKELGEADDIVFGRSNSKQEEGAVGLLTHGVIDRRALYEHAVVLALAPLRNPLLYH